MKQWFDETFKCTLKFNLTDVLDVFGKERINHNRYEQKVTMERIKAKRKKFSNVFCSDDRS